MMTNPKRLQVRGILMFRAIVKSLSRTNTRTIMRLFIRPLWKSLCTLRAILVFRHYELSSLISHLQAKAGFAPHTGTRTKQRLMRMRAMTTKMTRGITKMIINNLMWFRSPTTLNPTTNLHSMFLVPPRPITSDAVSNGTMDTLQRTSRARSRASANDRHKRQHIAPMEPAITEDVLEEKMMGIWGKTLLGLLSTYSKIPWPKSCHLRKLWGRQVSL